MIMIAGGLGIILLSGILALALERYPRTADSIFRWGVPAGCLAAIWPAVSLLVTGALPSRPTAGEVFGLDALSAWFTVMVLGVGAVTAVYGVRYLERERSKRRVGTAHLLLSILIVAITGVVTAERVVAFLASWELMAIAAFLLIIFEREHAEARRAGLIYLVVTHVSTIALIGMFAAWGPGLPGGGFQELAIAAVNHRVPVALVLGLGLIGFGVKAGVVPAHFWLPGAHAAAPSHVSAFLSGVMIKTGIYGLLRVLSLLGPPPAWWAWTILLLGLASAVLGVLWALAQHDIKRLLAYHSVENIGIILLGIGLGTLGQAYHHPALALLGFTGAVLHTLNHSLFKSLLFLGAGAVVHATGTREIDRLGGLARLMPRTAWAFLIGSAAIVGLPPLNGFVSEWMIFRGLFETGGTTGVLRTASAAACGLALTGALALACFTKLHGVLFLGTPRHTATVAPGAEQGLINPQLALAAACILIGVLPILVIPAAAQAASAVLHDSGGIGEVVAGASVTSAISVAALALLALIAIVWRLRARVAYVDRAALGPTWGCAFSQVTSRMQYTASSYAGNLLMVFGPLAGTHRVVGPGTLHVHAADPVLDRLGRPVWSWVQGAASNMRRLQTGRIFWYLLYVIFALVGFLLYLWFVTAP